jgi:hypothetical protein
VTSSWFDFVQQKPITLASQTHNLQKKQVCFTLFKIKAVLSKVKYLYTVMSAIKSLIDCGLIKKLSPSVNICPKTIILTLCTYKFDCELYNRMFIKMQGIIFENAWYYIRYVVYSCVLCKCVMHVKDKWISQQILVDMCRVHISSCFFAYAYLYFEELNMLRQSYKKVQSFIKWVSSVG